MHPFITIGGLLKRGALHLAGGVGIGLAGGEKTILPTAAVIGVKEAVVDPHPKEDNKRWWLKSALDFAAWTGGAIIGSLLRTKIGGKR